LDLTTATEQHIINFVRTHREAADEEQAAV
jgi:hypothetical protein